MALLLKKLRSGVASSVHDDGGEYSFAEEYKGPPLNYSIPEVTPFHDLDQIPLAPSPSHRFSLAVIQPLRKPNAESSPEIPSCKEDHGLSPKHVKKPSGVTFRDPQSNDMVDDDDDGRFVDESLDGESRSTVSVGTPVRPRAVRAGKKGSCYRCLKGNALTEREVCIVCSAKYCRKCVLRAMGSMPQGRKCLTCIGFGIDENKRGRLGKPSRMLKHLLSQSQVKLIMQDEMFSEPNQVPPQNVFVNGEPLNLHKLMLLLRCPNPPKGLKPGCYWYDKASGFWGKEGQRPSQIISPQLEVGGDLQRNASGGKTNVTINGREVTKEELFILKRAGVPCAGTTDFWVSSDGSYMEVGQKNVKGRIWDKSIVKLASVILSLPVPNSTTATTAAEGENVVNNIQQKTLHKFLLVGPDKSGTCTIFKQAKILYNNVPFSEDECQNIKLAIQSNLYRYLGILLEAREIFEEQNNNQCHGDESTSTGINEEIIETTIYSIGPRLKAFSEWLLKYMVSGNLDAIFPAATREYAPLVEELWRDAAIQATYYRRNEIKMLPKCASYFLERAVEISSIDYEPSEMDILYAEGTTLSKGLTSMEFSYPVSGREDFLDPEYQHDPSLRYELIRVHPKSLGQNCKWLEMFEDTDLILFSVALSDYDEYIVDNQGVATNKIIAAKNLFENIITHRVLNKKKFLLILTKFDALEEKIERVPLTQCEWFSEFQPVISHNHKKTSIGKSGNYAPLAQRAFQYIATKFKRLFHSLTDRKLFVSMVTGLEPRSVDEALRYAREVMVWEKWDPSLRNERSEITSTSIDLEIE